MRARISGETGLIGKLFLFGLLAVAAAVAGGVHYVTGRVEAHAVTQAQFDATRLGQSRTTVERRVGKPPGDLQIGHPPRVSPGMACTFYPQKGVAVSRMKVYRFCYVTGRLRVKNSYTYHDIVGR